MSRLIVLQIPEEVFLTMERAAARSGQSVTDWAKARLREAAPPDSEERAERERQRAEWLTAQLLALGIEPIA